jgi:hypothetical protein
VGKEPLVETGERGRERGREGEGEGEEEKVEGRETVSAFLFPDCFQSVSSKQSREYDIAYEIIWRYPLGRKRAKQRTNTLSLLFSSLLSSSLLSTAQS